MPEETSLVSAVKLVSLVFMADLSTRTTAVVKMAQNKDTIKDAIAYFKSEFELDYKVAAFSKPYVAFMDGVTSKSTCMCIYNTILTLSVISGRGCWSQCQRKLQDRNGKDHIRYAW